MIHSINSDHKKFKKIKFQKGFNIILADRTKKSSKKDSRNGLGKTTMINIIHFCLGEDPKNTLTEPALKDSTFMMELDLNGKKYTVSRSLGNSAQIFIDGDFFDWPIKPEKDNHTRQMYLKKDSWIDILGKFMFNLPIGLGTFHPTFRSMISYFVRKDNGFFDPFNQSSKQHLWDSQTNNAYLLNLGWKFATDLQILKNKKRDLDAFKRGITAGAFEEFMGNTSRLEVEITRLQIEADKQKKELDEFKVNDQYEQIEKKSNNITIKIHYYTNQNVIDELLLRRYNMSLKAEEMEDVQHISEMYKEAGLHLSEKIIKTLEEVNNFHNEIIENRKEFLGSEVTRLNEMIISRKTEIKQLDVERADLIEILNTQGALKEYTQIQKNYTNSQNQLNDVKNKLNILRSIKDKNNQIKIDKQQLYQNALIDMDERDEQKNNAVRAFGRFSSELYNEFGKLLIGLNENGFKFTVDIPRSSSHGIENMKIFCYDLTLVTIWSKVQRSPRFLIHDSMIFDGVDERQRASALNLAKKVSDQENFQYICTLNSDMIPQKDLEKDFDLQKYVVRRLTDSTEDGGILGIRI